MRGLRQILILGIGVSLITLLVWVLWLSVLVLHAEWQPTPAVSINQSPIESAGGVAVGDLVFVGDVMLARHVERIITRQGLAHVFAGLDGVVHDTDRLVINFEAAVPARHVPTPDYTFRFSVPAGTAAGLSRHQVAFASLANNHSFDFGAADYMHTAQVLETAGVVPYGHPYTFATSTIATTTLDGYTVALIGLSTLGFRPTAEQIDAVLDEATALSDVQVVTVHWGEEYNLNQNQAQRQLATQLIAAGADVIIGHHPHVVQGIEVIAGVPVFYSLGNFIFDQYFSTHVQQGLVVRMSLSNNGRITYTLVPVSSLSSVAQPRAMSTSERAAFLRSVSLRSSPKWTAAIAEGEISIPFTLATSS